MHPALATILLLACSAAAQQQPALPPQKPLPPAAAQAGKQMPLDPSRYAAAAVAWFPSLESTLEVKAEMSEAKHVFAFQNPRSQSIDWTAITGSCTCSSAVILVGDRRYELRSKEKKLYRVTGQPGAEESTQVTTIPVAAGESGQVEMHVDTHGAKGQKLVSLDIQTTDPAVPVMRLQLRANIESVFTVTPPALGLGIVPLGEERRFSVQVTSIAKDFAITELLPPPKGLTATFEQSTQPGPDGKAVWVIQGALRLDTPGPTNLTLQFKTNQPAAPTLQLPLHANAQALVEVKPSILTVGRVKQGQGTKAKVTFTAADGRTLNATALRLENLNVAAEFVTLRSTHEGKDLVVELEVSEKAPIGLMKGDVVVDLDHPSVKQKRLAFNAFVR
jgi:hypothetical protein